MSLELPDIVLEALGFALRQKGPARLIAKAKSPGLFPAKKSKEIAAAIQLCKAERLIDIVEIAEKKKGNATANVEFASPTGIGLNLLFRSTEPDRRTELLHSASASYHDAAEKAFFEVCEADLQANREQLDTVLRKESELSSQLRSLVAIRLSSLTETRNRIEQSIRDAEAAMTTAGNKTQESAPTKPPAQPRGEQDLDFQRDLAEQLVLAWQESVSAESKERFETVMFNIGIEQLGDRGQTIPFDNSTQDVDEPLEGEEPVEVVEPGWRLTSPRGVYLISRTKVRVVKGE